MSTLPHISSLPRVSDSWSFVYVEAAHIECHQFTLQIRNERYRYSIPIAQYLVLLAGPGTTISHDAAVLLANHGCSLVWCGESGVRFYGSAHPETQVTTLADLQVQAYVSAHGRSEIAHRLYRMRFPASPVDPQASIAQLRGVEGVQMRSIYRTLAQQNGLAWQGRHTDDDWQAHAPLQQAINVANSCLYGVCHAAIVAVGMIPLCGFVHRGNQRSFVFDIADLYKADVTLPIAFATVAESETNIAQRVRRACRDAFASQTVLTRIVPDLYALFAQPRPWVRYIDTRHAPPPASAEEGTQC